MVFLWWNRPNLQAQKSCTDKSDAFNYARKHVGATAKPVSLLREEGEVSKDGFYINHVKILVGSGHEAFEKGKNAIQTWSHFGFDWTFVHPGTPIREGVKFCVCVKEVLPWIMMPLKMVYVIENDRSRSGVASFGFGGGTLKGHLLAGEERFSVEIDENDQVWYEILSFSKPAHFLSLVGYPYVKFRQNCFTNQSIAAVRNYVSAR